MKKSILSSLKLLKKGVASGVGSGSVSQRHGSADQSPHQNVMDPQHFFFAGVSDRIPRETREGWPLLTVEN
jgi:hypothetical protein